MEFIKGMDISMVKELEVSGASYYIKRKTGGSVSYPEGVRNDHGTAPDLVRPV